jgi:hypothetical protein
MKKSTIMSALLFLIAVSFTNVSFAQCGGGSGCGGCGHKKAEIVQKELKVAKDGKDVAVIIVLQDKTNGKATFIFSSVDKKTPVELEKAPRINVKVDGKYKQLKTESVNGHKAIYAAASELFKKDVDGKVVFKIGEESYQVEINPKDEHEGHGPECNH